MKLGADRVIRAKVAESDGGIEEVTLTHRPPTAEEWVEFQQKLVAIQPDDDSPRAAAAYGIALNHLCREYGLKVLTDAEGFEPPEGMSVIEAIAKFGHEFAVLVGRRAFLEFDKIDLGKSEEPPASS